MSAATQQPFLPPTLPADLAEQVRRALAEDVGSGDCTARLIAQSTQAHASVICREDAVLCGTAWFDATFKQLSPTIHIEWQARDGDALSPDQTLCTLRGPARPLLTGERTALNFLQTLSGTATVAHRYANAVADTRCQILDTRKTLPGLRTAQKYAVACGGCRNHRIGLFDAILLKENHIMAAGSITAAVQQGKQTGVPVEIEVEALTQVEEALRAGADSLLLDNFSLADLHKAVEITKKIAPNTKLEASGNMSLNTIHAVAETGVDYISVGALTKHVRAVDLSMRFTLHD